MVEREFYERLELTNQGQLSLFFVGTGNAFSKKYFNTNLLVIKGSDHFLIDCGALCPFSLETKYKLKNIDIKNLFVTHSHADHIGGIEELVLSHKYQKNTKVNIFITDYYKKKLWNESLKGGCKVSDHGKMSFNDYFNQIKPVRITKKPFEIFETNCGNINIKFFRTMHITSTKGFINRAQVSYGVIIDNKVIFTGDTQFNESQLQYLLNKYPKVQMVFHDCDITGAAPSVHASYSQLKTLNRDIKAKMMLCHYNSSKEDIDCKSDGFAGYAEPGVYYDFLE